MKLRSVLKWVATTFGGTIVTPFLQAPATKLAEALHFDTTLSDRWGPLVQWLSDLAANPWYIAFASFAVGLPTGMWIDNLLRFRERKSEVVQHEAAKADVPATAKRSLIRLRCSGKMEAPTEIDKENIRSWFVYWTPGRRMTDPLGNPVFELHPTWIFFLTFEHLVEYTQVTTNFTGNKPQSWQVHQPTPLSVILSVEGGLPECELEIITRS